MGVVMKLCMERRGVNSNYPLPDPRPCGDPSSSMPLAEVLYDFYDRLKTVTQGYGSFDYELLDYRESDLGEARHPAQRGTGGCPLPDRPPGPCEYTGASGLREAQGRDPSAPFQNRHSGGDRRQRHLPDDHLALRKDVTAKCYGGDITRKRKLLEKQKKGKKRMKMVGKVMIPQSAFLAVLKTDTD